MKQEIEFTPAPGFISAPALTGAEKRASLRRKAKAKARGNRESRHQRADGWTEPESRAEAAERIAKFVIRRLKFPKYGEPLAMSKTDEADAMGAAMAACVATGFFDHGYAGPRLLKAIRNAVQGRACLRLRCAWEYATDDAAAVAAEAGFVTEHETVTPRLTRSQVDTAREIMRTLRASHATDRGRKRDASFRSQRDFFVIVLSSLTGRTPRAMIRETFDSRKSRFLDYLTRGSQQLRACRKPPRLAEEIMSALAARALA